MSRSFASERLAPGATLVILSYDEREALERLMPRIPLESFARVVAIDPGSTDGTLDIYRRYGIECWMQERKGRGNAFLLARDEVGTELVVFLSADGNEDPADLASIVSALEEGYELVIAGRFVVSGSETDVRDDPLRLRKAGAIGFGLAVRLLWGSRVWDATNGYRGFRVEAMRRMGLDAPGHEIEYQSTIRALKLGMRIKEIPTHERPRLGGWRKVTASTWSLGWHTARCLLRELAIGNRFEVGMPGRAPR